MKLEDVKVSTLVRGVVPDRVVTVKQATWFGDQTLDIIFDDSSGRLQERLLYRADEPLLELSAAGRPWSLDQRRHQALGYCTRSQVYFDSIAKMNDIELAA